MAEVIWGKLPCDNDESFRAFVSYRDQIPPRRIRSVVSSCTRDVSEWYRENNWRARTDAYDAHMDSIMLEEREAVLRQKAQEVAVEHMAILATARQVVGLEFSRILDATVNGGSAPGAAMKVAEVIKLAELVIKMDRLVRDQTTENTGVAVDLSKLSETELEIYGHLLEKIEEPSVIEH